MPDVTPQMRPTTSTNRLAGLSEHRKWLRVQADALFDFFEPNLLNPAGGFHILSHEGQPIAATSGDHGTERQIHDTTRMVHCFAIAKLMGRPNAQTYVDQGMDFIWNRHRDTKNGGYCWGVDDQNPTQPDKRAYGHAFVLLAASSAKIVGHRDADRLLADVSEVIHQRFWEASNGTSSEEYTVDWQGVSDYRGQNSNMHLTEALMAAYEATDDQSYLDMAQGIAEFFVNRHARASGWRVPEHFRDDWSIDFDFVGDPVFRPKGVTPGHGLEWSRLLIQLWQLGRQQHDWMPEAAKKLFVTAVNTGWNTDIGGLNYALDWDDKPNQFSRLWWPCAEGIAAASALGAIDADPVFEDWYRRVWAFVDGNFIDHIRGGWYSELDANSRPVDNVFVGKPDLYHALQACLIPMLPTNGSITRGLLNQHRGNAVSI
ncbi:MAG: sulfoquinovose isomerase [Paracoccaceae bacterium]|jgi:sulfoquinovose isomerase